MQSNHILYADMITELVSDVCKSQGQLLSILYIILYNILLILILPGDMYLVKSGSVALYTQMSEERIYYFSIVYYREREASLLGRNTQDTH